MKPLGQNLRRPIIEAGDAGEGSLRDLARRFAVDLDHHPAAPDPPRGPLDRAPPHGGGMPSTLDEAGHERLGELASRDPDAMLARLRDHLGLRGRRIMAVMRTLKKWRITRKLKTLRAAERDRPESRRQRRSFRRRIAALPPERLIVLDETGVTTLKTMERPTNSGVDPGN